MNDIQFSQNEIIEQLANLHMCQRQTNNLLHELESRVEHIDYHMHEPLDLLAMPPLHPP